jgi:outer membrane porin, OprD family
MAPPLGAVLWILSLMMVCATPVPAPAADLPAPEPAASGAQTQPADSDEAATPDSTEQGQTQLPESFEHRPIQALLHESSLVGLRDTTFNVQLRSFFLDRDNFNTSQSEAWTLGGSVGFKTGYFGDFIALGSTTYTSQRVYGPLDKDGTKLLQTDQKPYTAIGELYGQFRLTDEIVGIVGRRGFDTPFINTQDSLMTPNTFVVYAVQGVVNNADDSTVLRFGGGYVDKIKPRNAQDFESMATAAGAPSGVDRGVYVAGGNYKSGQFSIGAINYYSADIIDIAYTEINYAIPLASRVTLRLAAQYTDQHSTGNDLLTGKPFSTDQYGVKAEIGFGSALVTAAHTATAIGAVSSNGSGTDMRNPWGGYPGYTAVQIENFYRAGEDATMLRAAYNFPKTTGLSVYALWVDGTTPHVAQQYAQREYDFNVQWNASNAALKGLKLLARYGHVSQGGPSDQHENELRLALYYQWR